MDGTIRTRLMSVMEENGNSASTQTLYIRNVEKLYEKMLPLMKRPSIFKNLNFLRETELVEKVLEDYAENTKKSYLTAIVVIMKADGLEKKPNKKAYDYWYSKMMTMAEELKKVDTTQLTPTQKENWLDWDEIVAKYDDLKKQVKDTNWITTAKTHKTDTLIKDMLVLSLYTNLQPRRNQDYSNMVISLTPMAFSSNDYETDPTLTIEETLKLNYICLPLRLFVFNAFKTAKSIGKQEVKVPDTLWDDIITYLSYNNRLDTEANKVRGTPYLLQEKDGEVFKPFNINTITRVLNRVLGKKIGCSMLRHIYLSKKYGDTYTEQQADADIMAHSTGTQKQYIKLNTPTVAIPINVNGTDIIINGNLLP